MFVVENSIGEKLVDYVCVDEVDLCVNTDCSPMTGSYVIFEYYGRFLFGFNTWRKQWEIPSGGIEEGENPRECAVRELFEETGQSITVDDLLFKGLVKVYSGQKKSTRFRTVYYVKAKSITYFIENDEMSNMLLWDLRSNIGKYDLIDFEILKHYMV